MTSASLTDAIENPATLVPSGVADTPTYLEVIRVIDLAAKFKGTNTFVEESTKHFPQFYQDVGQHLSQWVAKAPKVKEPEQPSPSIPTIFSGTQELAAEENNDDASSTYESADFSTQYNSQLEPIETTE